MAEVNKSDKRYVKCEKLLRSALMSLMSKNDFQKITIQEIADTAGVGRATFYKHYDDKADLLKAIEQQMITDIQVLLSIPAEIGESSQERNARKAFALLSYLDENVETACVLLGVGGPADFQEEIIKVLWNGFYKGNKNFCDIVKQASLPQMYVSSFLRGYYTLLQTWLSKSERESPKEVIKNVGKMHRVLRAWMDDA